MNRHCSRKTISNEVKKRLLMNGLEFDPTAVGALKSTITRSFDVAEAVYRCLQWPYQLNVDLKRNRIFFFAILTEKFNLSPRSGDLSPPCFVRIPGSFADIPPIEKRS